ncbi:MAG TPA: DUF1501 domain-containing protein [Gemmataceae bacterium]|nr:DUF1501 domain-containing protein [Gemmataceae bacterium]
MNHRGVHADYRTGFVSRRCLLQIGGLGCLGLNLAGLFRAEARSAGTTPLTKFARPSRVKSCILLFYYGGPSHLDTWDLKPAAPAEVRGEFRPAATAVPGLRICEHLPHCARVMDKLAIVRSLHHPMRNHNSAAVEALCGRTPLRGDLELLADDPNSFPCYGSTLSFLRPGQREIPAHVALPHVMHNVVVLPGQTAGFLGAAYNPFQITKDPNEAHFNVAELELPSDLSLARLEDRRTLLSLIDAQTNRAERLAGTGAMTVYQERALHLLRSKTVRQAFDLSPEPPPLRERYGRNTLGQSLLLARRLVEAGVRFINVHDKVHNGQLANWDSHENNFQRLKNDLLPPADRAFSTLIEDLDARGLLESTLVVALAEFGRTPRINKSAGRDHWPDCYSMVLAGGGVRGGIAYGASDKMGAYPASDPVTPGDLAATLFWAFGLDTATEIHDLTGRPYRLAEGQPIRKLFA